MQLRSRPPCAGPGASRPCRRRAVRVAAVASVPRPTAPPPLPQLEGGLPLLGVFGRYDLLTLYKEAQDQFVDQKARLLEMEMLGRKSVFLRHPDDFSAALRDTKRFKKGEAALAKLSDWLGNGLASNVDTVNHAAVKEVLMPAFKSASIKGFVPAFAKVGEEMVEILAAVAGKPFDVEPLCRRATLDVIGRTGFGFEFQALKASAYEAGAGPDPGPEYIDVIKMYDHLLEGAMYKVFNLPVPDTLLPKQKEYMATIQVIDGIIEKMVAERRAGGIPEDATDLLAFMLRAQDAGNAVMTDKQLRDELQTMILAGSDTTATTLAFALGELSRRPELAAAAAAEVRAALGGADPKAVGADVYQKLPLIAGIAYETLRLYPAVTETGRECVQEETFGEYTVPAGTMVLPSMYSLQRHEDYWPRPNEWLPERWLPENKEEMAPHADACFSPFTVGPRSCIGRFFATLELQVLLAVLLQKLIFEAAPGLDLDTKVTFTLISKSGIPVIPGLRV